MHPGDSLPVVAYLSGHRRTEAAEAQAEVFEADFTGFLVFTLGVSALFQRSFERLESRALILFRPQNCFRALGHEVTMAILPIWEVISSYILSRYASTCQAKTDLARPGVPRKASEINWVRISGAS